MAKFIDKTGMIFGQLTVLSRAENKGKYIYWNCKCSCGKEVCVRGDTLTASRVDDKGNPSCGHLRIQHVVQAIRKDLLGQRFGRLLVIKETEERTHNGSIIWECECDCGNITYVSSDQLLKKNGTKSCGCLQKEIASAFLKAKAEEKSAKIGTYENSFFILDKEYRVENDGSKKSWVYARCPFCENQKWFPLIYIRQGDVKSCGCISKKSAGEEKIIKILEENSIPYETEKIFDDLKYKNHIRFDFYILSDKKYLIEYDGIQHFQPVSFTKQSAEKTQQEFEEYQKRDQLKNEYCINNNIPLIRIPYTHYNNLCLEDLLLETTKFLYNPNKEEAQ